MADREHDPLAAVAADLNGTTATSPETAELPATSAEAGTQTAAMEMRWVTDSRGNPVRLRTLVWAHQAWAIVIAAILLLVHHGSTVDNADPATPTPAHTTTPTTTAPPRTPFRDPPWATARPTTPPTRTPTPPTPPLGGPDPARPPTLGDLQ